jgi:S1-C subfamily serine protease
VEHKRDAAVSLTTMLSAGLILLMMVLGWACRSEAQITTNVFRRVLMLRVGESTGTGFTVDVDKREYLVTAKHLVDGLNDRATIDVMRGNKWVPITVKVFRCQDPIDVAVLAPANQLTVSFPLEPISGNILVGQEILFLGFPYGVQFSSAPEGLAYPFPFTRKATFSSARTENGAHLLFLDGYNNPGFSGAPMLVRDLKQPAVTYTVIGIVTGFRPELDPVMVPKELQSSEDTSKIESWRIITLPNGRRAKLVDTESMVRANTGIVIGYDISHAIDLIRQNLVGAQITQENVPY